VRQVFTGWRRAGNAKVWDEAIVLGALDGGDTWRGDDPALAAVRIEMHSNKL
jgi:hypothetical protein